MNESRLLETFLELVRIDSPPGSEAGCAARCAELLQAAGCRVEFDDSAPVTGSDTGNLIAELPGTTGATLALSAHLDVVEPCRGIEPRVVDGVIVSAGETVLGGDDRVGLAVAIETIRSFAESDAPRPTLKALFTVQEELGLVGAKELPADKVACDLCLVLDADGAPGGIVVAAPTHYTFAAEFLGKAAHAGVQPEAGISAVAMAADAICHMPLGRLDAETTANVGAVRGGSATNVVAARCEVTGECRSLERARVEEVKETMNAALVDAARRAGGSVDIVWKLEYESFRFAADDPLVVLVSAAATEVGLTPRTFATGGGSDANVLASLGVPTLALACGMTGVHGTHEQLAIRDMNALAALVQAVARRMAGVSA